MLVAVVVAAVNANDGIFYDVGYGTGQKEFNWPPGLPYINFHNFSKNNWIVKNVTIFGKFKDMKRADGNFYFHLRLQNNEKDTRDLNGWDSITYALYVRPGLSPRNYNKESRTYLYKMHDGPKEQLEFKYPISIRNSANFMFDKKKFALKMQLLPSHIQFTLKYVDDDVNSYKYGEDDETSCENGADDENSYGWKQHYGYFYEKEDAEDHTNHFSDSIFDTIHIEGDVDITRIEVKSGGEVTQQKTLTHPKWFCCLNEKTGPCKNGYTFDQRSNGQLDKCNVIGQLDKSCHVKDYPKYYARQYKFYNGGNHSNSMGGYGKNRWDTEIIIRGKTLESRNKLEFVFIDVSAGEDYQCNISTITYDQAEKKLRITGLKDLKKGGKCGKEDVYSAPIEKWIEYNSFHNKYSACPFKDNTHFEISVRRLSNSNQNRDCSKCKAYNDYNGYPRKTLQITIRVENRIYTWYIRADPQKIIHELHIYGSKNFDDIIDEVVYFVDDPNREGE